MVLLKEVGQFEWKAGLPSTVRFSRYRIQDMREEQMFGCRGKEQPSLRFCSIVSQECQIDVLREFLCDLAFLEMVRVKGCTRFESESSSLT